MAKPIVQAFIFALYYLHLFAGGSARSLFVRAEDKIPEFHGAVLLKSGVQTSCEIGLMTNRYGYAAASCFKLDSDLKAINISQYEVLFDSSSSSPTPGRFGIASVTINPYFDPKTFANNVAVVIFNSQSSKLWVNYIDRDPFEKTDRLYVRRSASDVLAQKWNHAASVNDTTIHDTAINDKCKSASSVYSENTIDMWCTTVTTSSPVGGLCNIPYSLVYGEIGKDLGVSGIYSHTATYDDMACGSKQQYHYYTLLYNYNMWASEVVQEAVMAFSISTESVSSNSTNYRMNPWPYNERKGVKVFSGDLFARDASNNLWAESTTLSAESSSSASASKPASSGTATGATSSVAETPTLAPANSSSSSLSKNEIIALAVAVPIGTIIALVALFFGYKRWMRHKKSVAWDPSNETQAMREVALDFGSTGAPADAPPRYDAQNFTIDASSVINSK